MAHLRISRTILLATVVGALMLLLPATAAAHVGVGIGFWGPGWGYWGPYPYYGYYPYYGGYYGGYYPGYYPGYGYRPMGEVKIKSPQPNAEIYINGSLAGRAHDLKHFYLRPGAYNIEQRNGEDVQKQRVYVLANRTIKIEFGPVGGQPVPLPPPESGEHKNPYDEGDY